MDYKIDRNVPLPKERKAANKRYPLSDMRIGDSFFVGGREDFERARLAATNYGRRNKLKFSSRLADDKDGGRIWRIE